MDFRVKVIRPAPYQDVFDAMRTFTAERTADTPDEIWLCEHFPVYTLGLAGKPEHVLAPHDIPVVHANRGGQVTYHGPGQVVAYVLMDMRRCNYYVRDYVRRLEQGVIETLSAFGVKGFLVPGAPGVYVHTAAQAGVPDALPLPQANPKAPDFTGLAKIAALGVKVSNHCTYHGVALNVDMDLQPFRWINPCGYPGLQTTDLRTIGVAVTRANWSDVAQTLARALATVL